MANATFQLETVSCPSCVAKIEGALKKTPGVEQAEVLFNSSRVKATFDESATSAEALKGTIEKLGYKVLSVR